MRIKCVAYFYREVPGTDVFGLVRHLRGGEVSTVDRRTTDGLGDQRAIAK
ncbi:hypothetical protein VB711_11560 [Cronbergia sp. UHCC 0137]|nr:hypothetical protein [Cronbergia sp. UHCC 0137]MEA5618468.1 hypothetical protein [Cronbergia sp. UHCC 0137]